MNRRSQQNKMLYLITYDLKEKTKDYLPLYEAIKTSGLAWWHYLDSTWIVQAKPGEEADNIFRRLEPHIHKETDYILVIDLGANRQGWLPKEAWDWFKTVS